MYYGASLQVTLAASRCFKWMRGRGTSRDSMFHRKINSIIFTPKGVYCRYLRDAAHCLEYRGHSKNVTHGISLSGGSLGGRLHRSSVTGYTLHFRFKDDSLTMPTSYMYSLGRAPAVRMCLWETTHTHTHIYICMACFTGSN